jgi:hypothetical protein
MAAAFTVFPNKQPCWLRNISEKKEIPAVIREPAERRMLNLDGMAVYRLRNSGSFYLRESRFRC